MAKSILEEALLDAKKIQAALDANTREILRSVAKEEIDGLVKESFLQQESDFDEEEIGAEPEVGGEPEVGNEIGSEPVMGGAEEIGAEPEVGAEMGGEPEMGGTEELGAGIEGSEEVGGPEMGDQEFGMGADALAGDDMDLTAASDDDVIAIYKKLSGEDEIEIVGDDVHLNASTPGEYIIKGAAKGAQASAGAPIGGEELGSEIGAEPEIGAEAGAEGDDVEYEVELDGEGSEGGEEEVAGDEPEADAPAEPEADAPAEEEAPTEDEPEEELDEQISQNQVAANRAGGHLTTITGPGAKGLDEKYTRTKALLSERTQKYNSLVDDANRLKLENDEFRLALKKFRGMLVETVVFNSNLSYVTKLFMEHATTKDEKKAIIERFDEEVSNLKESKKLYKAIATELTTRKPLTESVDKKIIKEATSGSSKQLNENTAYVDPSTLRILDLMKRTTR